MRHLRNLTIIVLLGLAAALLMTLGRQGTAAQTTTGAAQASQASGQKSQPAQSKAAKTKSAKSKTTPAKVEQSSPSQLPAIGIIPTSAHAGQSTDFLLTSPDCKNLDLNKLAIRSVPGQVEVTSQAASENGCYKRISLALARSAAVGQIHLSVESVPARGATPKVAATISFDILEALPDATVDPANGLVGAKQIALTLEATNCKALNFGSKTTVEAIPQDIPPADVMPIGDGCRGIVTLDLSKATAGQYTLSLEASNQSIVRGVAPFSVTGPPEPGNLSGNALSISPSVGVLGMKYDVTLKSNDCKNLKLTGLDLVPPQGSGLTITNPVGSADGCSMGATIEIDPKAPIQKVTLLLEASTPNAPASGGTSPASGPNSSQSGSEGATVGGTVQPGNVVAGSESSSPAPQKGQATSSSTTSVNAATSNTGSASPTKAASSGSSPAPTKTIKGTVDFEVVPVLASPIPPGLQPQVDVTWTVLPDNVTKDNFGGYISRRYFCVQLAIGNNSGYPIEISNVHFTGIPGSKLASTSYHATRASLERGQKEDTTRRLRQIVTISLGVATSLVPFGGNPATTAEGVLGVLSNAAPGAIDVAFPDLTTDELNRLDDQTLKDDLIVPNNSEPTIKKAFVAKDSLASVLPDEADLKPQATILLGGRPGTGDIVDIWIGRDIHVSRKTDSDTTLDKLAGDLAYDINAAEQDFLKGGHCPDEIDDKENNDKEHLGKKEKEVGRCPNAITATSTNATITLTAPYAPTGSLGASDQHVSISLSASATGTTTVSTSGAFLVSPVATECVHYKDKKSNPFALAGSWAHVCIKRTTTDEVARALGQLDFTGDLIDFKARINMQSNPAISVTPTGNPPKVDSMNPATLTRTKAATAVPFSMTGSELGGANLSAPSGITISNVSIDPAGKTLSGEIAVDCKASTTDPQKIQVTTKSGAAQVTVTVKDDPNSSCSASSKQPPPAQNGQGGGQQAQAAKPQKKK